MNWNQVACRRLSDGTYVKVDHKVDDRMFKLMVGSVEDQSVPADKQQVTWRFEAIVTSEDMMNLMQDLSRSLIHAEKVTAGQFAQLMLSWKDANRRLAEAKRPL